MKKTIIPVIMFSAALLVACNNNTNNRDSSLAQPSSEVETNTYEVTKEQYEQSCYDFYVPRINSLNFTVTYTEYYDGDVVFTSIAKLDNGKLMTSLPFGEFYYQFIEGSYEANPRTLSYYGYFNDGGLWTKVTHLHEDMPDNIYLPNVAFFMGYEEMDFNPDTNYYEQISESKEMEGYIFSKTKAQFLNGNLIHLSYKISDSRKEYTNVMDVTDYGSTVVNLPIV